MQELEELKKEIYSLGPQWNLFGMVDRLKTLIARIEKKLYGQ